MIEPFESMENLTFIRAMQPQGVFELWRENEEKLAHWQQYWKGEGYESWEAWRGAFFEKFNIAKKEWGLYEVIDPMHTVALWRGGPFSTWQEKYYNGEEFATFAHLAQTDAAHIDAVRQMAHNFPSPTTLTALFTEQGPIVLEGMHRSVALALLAKEEKSEKIRVRAALAKGSCAELADAMKRIK